MPDGVPVVERQAERCAEGDLDDLAHRKSPLHPAGKARSAFQGSLLSDTGCREALEGVSHSCVMPRRDQSATTRPTFPGYHVVQATSCFFTPNNCCECRLVETGRLRVTFYGPRGGRCGAVMADRAMASTARSARYLAEAAAPF